MQPLVTYPLGRICQAIFRRSLAGWKLSRELLAIV
jgi:hypothetical protein